MKIIYLIPLGGFSTHLRSDTLWGMLCWGIRYLWGASELEQFIKACAGGNPEFVISSTFPYKQHGRDKIPFFPNPLIHAGDGMTNDVEVALEHYRLRKKLKSVAWLSVDDFNAMLQGHFTMDKMLDRVLSEYQLKKQAFEDGIEFFPSGQTVHNAPPIFESFSVTHNTIDRLRGGTLSIADPEEPDNRDLRSGQLFSCRRVFLDGCLQGIRYGKTEYRIVFLGRW